MDNTMQRDKFQRAGNRTPTEAAISCRPFFCSGPAGASDGIMRNFSGGGSYIVSSHRYAPGNILIVRMVRYPTLPASISDEDRPRSLCLAEVKWMQELPEENTMRYGLGLRCLD